MFALTPPDKQHLRSTVTTTLTVVLTVFCVFGHSLANVDEWRPIPASLFSEAQTIEPGSSLEAIFLETKIERLNNESYLDFYGRVKIFDEPGCKLFQTVEVEYQESDRLKYFSARIVGSDGKVREYSKADAWKNEILKRGDFKINRSTIVLPNLRPGDIVDYRYRLNWTGDISEQELDMRSWMPAREISYLISSTYSNVGLRVLRFGDDVVEESRVDGYVVLRSRNVKGLSKEPHSPPHLNIVPWLRIYRSSDSPDHEKYWKAVAKAWDVWFRQKVHNGGALKEKALELTQNISDEREKMTALFHFCRSEIRNTDFQIDLGDKEKARYSRDIDDPNNILHDGIGSAQAIDILFASMANSLGYEVRPLLGGDKRRFFFSKDLPDRSMIGYNGIAVKLQRGWYLSNPGQKYLPEGRIYWMAEGEDALLPGRRDVTWIQIPVSSPEYNRTEKTIDAKVSEGGDLTGKATFVISGSNAWTLKSEFYSLSKEAKIAELTSRLKTKFPQAVISEIAVEDELSAESPFRFSFKFIVPRWLVLTGRRGFIKTNPFDYHSLTFADTRRENPIYFDYPFQVVEKIAIEVPTGFGIEILPKSRLVDGSNDVAALSIAYGSVDDTVKVERVFTRGRDRQVLYPVSAYDSLRTLFNAIQRAKDEPVVLTK
ncbi:MAG: DUF3857 domain-containing protein [Acidobacteria bacterium]|nr:DUF3857 domain-containing protein [Acidobacteriota bacterium]